MLFRFWRRTIEGWRIRARSWAPDKELGLLLLEALRGDTGLIAQEESAHRIAQDSGVDYLLAKLRTLEENRFSR
eukprot:2565724-Amphidinium_carterae.1